MKLLFYRNTHDENGNLRDSGPEHDAVWNSEVHYGGTTAHLLHSTVGFTFDELMKGVREQDEFNFNYETQRIEETEMDSVLASLFELVRVGLVRYEIRDTD